MEMSKEEKGTGNSKKRIKWDCYGHILSRKEQGYALRTKKHNAVLDKLYELMVWSKMDCALEPRNEIRHIQPDAWVRLEGGKLKVLVEVKTISHGPNSEYMSGKAETIMKSTAEADQVGNTEESEQY